MLDIRASQRLGMFVLGGGILVCADMLACSLKRVVGVGRRYGIPLVLYCGTDGW